MTRTSCTGRGRVVSSQPHVFRTQGDRCHLVAVPLYSLGRSTRTGAEDKVLTVFVIRSGRTSLIRNNRDEG